MIRYYKERRVSHVPSRGLDLCKACSPPPPPPATLTTTNTIASPTTAQLQPVVKAFLAGSFSATVSTLCFQPLDTVKTRIQQVPSARVGFYAAARQVVLGHNLAGLWHGLLPSLLRTVPGLGCYFSAVHGLKTAVVERNGGSAGPNPLQAMLIGGTARLVAGCLTIPMTVVKIRFESGLYNYSSLAEAVRRIAGEEGVRGLSRGLMATLLRDVPFSSLYLYFYHNFQGFSKRSPLSVISGHAAANFLCGVGAGVVASLLTQPADVIKTRQQLGCSGGGSATFLGAAASLVREAGWRGLWAGSVPRVMRRTLMAALAWTVYERVITTAGLK